MTDTLARDTHQDDASGGGTTSSRDTSATFFAVFTPENNSGVLGLGRVTLNGGTLAVDAVASGLTPDQAHPFHLHAFPDDRPERVPTVADDANADGLVQTAEAAATAYGPVLVPLTTGGGPGTGAFPVADAKGMVAFSQTYQLDPGNAADAAILQHLDTRLEGRVLNLHGLDLSAQGQAAEHPTLPAAPDDARGGGGAGDGGYDPMLPVAAAQLLGLPADADARLADLAGTDSASFLARAEAVLSALQPYALDPSGHGPAAPEPARPKIDDYLALLAPSNNSGAFGAAAVHIDEAAGTLTVRLVTDGLTPDMAHAMHIHGFSNGDPSLLPSATLDGDRDGFVEDQEGERVVGPVLVGLTADGSVTNAELTADFPVADDRGGVALRQTYRFDLADPVQKSIFTELEDRLAGREVQIHGLTVAEGEGAGTRNEVDGSGGYKPELPVANGILLPVTDDPASHDMAALAQALFGHDLVFGA